MDSTELYAAEGMVRYKGAHEHLPKAERDHSNDLTASVPPVTTSSSGSISGTVYQNDGVTPIAGMMVYLFNKDWDWIDDVTTNANGRYVFSFLAPRSYYVQASGYIFDQGSQQWVKRYLPETYRGYSGWTGANLVEVTASNETSGIDFTLDPAGFISGTVYKSDGVTPIANAWVYMYDENWQFLFVIGKTTDDAGHYFFDGLRAGNYFVRATGKVDNSKIYLEEFYHESPNQEGADSVVVTPPYETSGIDFTLEKPGSLSGTVYESDGTTPIAGAEVYLYDENWNIQGFTHTGANGGYVFSSLHSGKYFTWASGWVLAQGMMQLQRAYIWEYYHESLNQSEANSVAVTEGNETSGIDFTLEWRGSISGRAYETDGSTPIAGAEVRVYGENWDEIRGGQTDPEGRYVIRDLRAGVYFVQATGHVDGQGRVYFEEYYRESPDQAGADSVRVVSDQRSSIDFTLEKPGRISGKVYRGDGSTPIVDAEVALYHRNWHAVTETRTDAEGHYTFGFLRSGHYYVHATGQIYNTGTGQWQPKYAEEYYRESPNHAGADSVAVTAGNETSGIDFTLSPPVAPIVRFSATPTSGYPELSVRFRDESEGAATAWLWDFHDGATSTERHPSHVYCTPGVYDVSLEISTVDGQYEKKRQGMIHVFGDGGVLHEKLELVDNNSAFVKEGWDNAIDEDVSGWDGTVTAQDSVPTAVFAFKSGRSVTIH